MLGWKWFLYWALWTSDSFIVNESHTWYSDDGVSRYNCLLYKKQVIIIPDSVGPFFLAMDTYEDRLTGRIDGEYRVYWQTTTFHVTEQVTDVFLSERHCQIYALMSSTVYRVARLISHCSASTCQAKCQEAQVGLISIPWRPTKYGTTASLSSQWISPVSGMPGDKSCQKIIEHSKEYSLCSTYNGCD